jgi:hypothetical protein
MPAAVNTEINGWCPTCVEWTVRGRREQCTWCDTPLTDGRTGGGRTELPPRVLRALVRDALDRMGEDLQEEREARERALSEAREARSRRGREQTERRLATMRANGNKAGKPVGKHMKAITEDLIREAHELYSVGRNEQGRPLSVRAVAAIILPRTGYKSAASCAECLSQAWKVRGWPLRDRLSAVRAATVVHGELVGTKDWTTDDAKAKKNAYRRQRRRRVMCTGRTVAGEPCPLWAKTGKDVCEVHDEDTKLAVQAKLSAGRLKRLRRIVATAEGARRTRIMASIAREQDRLAALERQAQATTTEGAADVSRDHRQGHDDERASEALAWIRGRARNEAA